MKWGSRYGPEYVNRLYKSIKKQITKDQIVIYTGPIDHYFSQSGYPPLEYRSINFEITRIFNTLYYQPNSVVNYPGPDTPYTRCVEYKHFLNQQLQTKLHGHLVGISTKIC